MYMFLIIGSTVRNIFIQSIKINIQTIFLINNIYYFRAEIGNNDQADNEANPGGNA